APPGTPPAPRPPRDDGPRRQPGPAPARPPAVPGTPERRPASAGRPPPARHCRRPQGTRRRIDRQGCSWLPPQGPPQPDEGPDPQLLHTAGAAAHALGHLGEG